MIGPGRGHNIIPILKILNEQTIFEIDFLCHALELKRNEYQHINFIPFPKVDNSLISRINYLAFLLRHSVFGKKYDILHNQGETGFFTLFLVTFIRAKIKIFTPWSYGVIERARKSNLNGFISQLLFFNSDFISINWVEIKESIEEICPKCKFLIFLWGLSDDFFKPINNNIASKFAIEFLNSIPRDEVIVFWPRSIIKYHRQDLVIEALRIIKDDTPSLLSNFTLYLWSGNVEDVEYRAEIEQKTAQYNLQRNVKIIDHPFVPYNDIRNIELRSNFFIQISEYDGISTFILEMLLQEKDIILSNIKPYKHFNHYFNLQLDLVNNNPNDISFAIKNKLINLNNNNLEIKAKRRDIVETNFKFSENYNEFIHYLNNIV